MSPTDLDSALRLYDDRGGKLIAGGTDIFPSSRQGHTLGNFLDLSLVEDLSVIELTSDFIRIGSATTWTSLINFPFPPAFDALKDAAREVGGIQIQNVGTIGGNLCNASPAADGVPPLLALDASVELSSSQRGTRVLKLSNFLLGVRQTALSPDEILTAILIPHPSDSETSAFEKLGSRRYLVISITMTAAIIECDTSGLITKARIAVGSCSPVAQRLSKLEDSIIGIPPLDITISPEHLSVLSPIDDVRGSSAYRLDVVAEQCKRAIMRASSK